ncbi:MAG TPA: acylphosphatase [Methylomirabilota bacterium]|jgi:acylphosphatase|nr:acylphosphatase [Methylomirabilota bacterium]
MTRARFVVHGAVQGVNFRASAVREALRLAITGRVWNSDEGTVELIAEGSGGALASLQNWLNEGPPGADVTEVERTELGGKPRYEGFNIAWSAPRGD